MIVATTATRKLVCNLAAAGASTDQIADALVMSSIDLERLFASELAEGAATLAAHPERRIVGFETMRRVAAGDLDAVIEVLGGDPDAERAFVQSLCQR